MNHSPHQRSAAGFSLLEILIAVVVLSIGVLGMASLQFASLRSNQQSYQRSQATALVSSLLDRMRANQAVAATGAYALAVSTTPTAVTTDCATVSCTPAQLAVYDLSTWHTTLTQTLPSATASITCSVTPCRAGATQIVTVLWDENRTGASDTSCPAPASFDPDVHLSCYRLGFTP